MKKLFLASLMMGLALVNLSVVMAGINPIGDGYEPAQARTIWGCADTPEGEACITIYGSFINDRNGSSHKAFIVPQAGTLAEFTIGGDVANVGNIRCTQDQRRGTSNGDLRIKTNNDPQVAQRWGPGLFVQANSAGRFMCDYDGTMIEVRRTGRDTPQTPVFTDDKTIKGSTTHNGILVELEIRGTLVVGKPLQGVSHSAFVVPEGTGISLKLNEDYADSGNVFCTAAVGTGNGTLKIRANAQKAGKQGGGLWVAIRNQGRLTCEVRNGLARGAIFEVN